MARHDESAKGTDAQRQQAAEREAEQVAARNLREQLRREGKVRGDGTDR